MNTESPPSEIRPRDRRFLKDWLRRLPPKWLFKFVAWLGFRPPPMKALFDASLFMLPQWMYAAARLRLAEQLAQTVRTTEALAHATGVNQDRMGRLLYALEQNGYFQRCPGVPKNSFDGPWENTAKSVTLLEDHPNTIRPILLHWIEDCYGPAGRFLDSLRQDECAFTLENGPEYPTYFGDFLPKNPERSRQFSQAMSASSAFTDQAVLSDFPWQKFSALVDVGGSNGTFLDLTLKRHSEMTGIIFDLPDVVTSAKSQWGKRTDAVAERIDFAAGSFFDAETVPPIGDGEAYILRNILHDWSNEDSLRILKNLRQGVGDSDGRLVLVELGLGFASRGHIMEQARSTIDMLMLTMFEGRERRLQDFDWLFRESGFELVSVSSTRSIAQVIEARPKR